jgi:hypothetical protein
VTAAEPGEDADRAACVHRILLRYVVEIVERYDLCPWAVGARLHGEVVDDVVWGARPPIAAWVATARRLAARPTARVIVVVAPELDADLRGLERIRDEVAPHVPDLAIAAFHPDAALDLGSPARLVPFLRRSPDPMLQLVPFAVLEALRPPTTIVVDPLDPVSLAAASEPARKDPVERIAVANHATVTADREAILAGHAAIAADRDASYAARGISTSRRRRSCTSSSG